MSFERALLGIVLLGVIVALIRAANLLSGNPYQRIKTHENLAGKLPDDATFVEKQNLLDRYGLAPGNPSRIPWLIVAVAVFFILVATWS
jgi:hypothetical protein